MLTRRKANTPNPDKPEKLSRAMAKKRATLSRRARKENQQLLNFKPQKRPAFLCDLAALRETLLILVCSAGLKHCLVSLYPLANHSMHGLRSQVKEHPSVIGIQGLHRGIFFERVKKRPVGVKVPADDVPALEQLTDRLD
jgi:hypothetical protein